MNNEKTKQIYIPLFLGISSFAWLFGVAKLNININTDLFIAISYILPIAGILYTKVKFHKNKKPLLVTMGFILSVLALTYIVLLMLFIEIKWG